MQKVAEQDAYSMTASAASRSLVSTGGGRVLMLSSFAIVALSVPAFFTRFLNDMDYYALVSDKLLKGAILYRDALDTKPPLIFIHYAAIFQLFGRDNLAAVKIVTIVWLMLSAFAMYAIRRSLHPSSSNPERVAALFVLAS